MTTSNSQPPQGVAAVPGQKGGQDLYGAYEPVRDWPKPLSTLPGHEQWTWGSCQGIFAESPNRVFVLQRGELPDVPRPGVQIRPEYGLSISLPAFGVPFRNATVSSPPTNGGPDQIAEEGLSLYEAPLTQAGGRGFTIGVDGRWEHCIVVVDAAGNIVEEWTQWDSMLKRPHSVYISPYDPQKRVWVVDDHLHAIFVFTNDGKELVQTIGTPGVLGADGTHFHRPTFIAWLPDGTFFVSDGYNGNRVAKFDKDGKFLLDWGQRGTPLDTRPGYFNTVHGIVVDPSTRRVFVNDRSNKRIQVFDENGVYLYEWSVGPAPAENYTLYMGEDGNVWGADHAASRLVKWDPDGHFLYSWGMFGQHPGGFWGVHQISVDQEGNVYVAEVNNGRVQKFRPRSGANPAFLVSRPVYSAWS